MVADKTAGLAVPIHDYLLKPIQPNRLLASLAALGVAPYTGQKILIVDDEIKVARLLNRSRANGAMSRSSPRVEQSRSNSRRSEQPAALSSI